MLLCTRVLLSTDPNVATGRCNIEIGVASLTRIVIGGHYTKRQKSYPSLSIVAHTCRQSKGNRNRLLQVESLGLRLCSHSLRKRSFAQGHFIACGDVMGA